METLKVLKDNLNASSLISKKIFFPLGKLIFFKNIAAASFARFLSFIAALGALYLGLPAFLFIIFLFINLSSKYFILYSKKHTLFSARKRKIRDIFAQTVLIAALGLKVSFNVFSSILFSVVIVMFFLYFYSAIAFLLIIPSDIRLSRKEELIEINKLFLTKEGFFILDKDFLYLTLMTLLLFLGFGSMPLLLILLILIGFAAWLLQLKIIWGKINV